MHTSTNIIETDLAGGDHKESLLTQDNIFLFVSDRIAGELRYKNYFPNSIRTSDFAGAKKQLKRIPAVELIIIDIPLDKVSLVEFKVWLMANQLNGIPVIYNECALNSEDTRQLFVQGLVDDVVHLEKNFTKLPYKARFIQKLYNNNKQNNTAVTGHHKFKNKSLFAIRVLDIFVSSLAILFLLPVFVLIAIAVKLESKGPVFYSALRAGRGFRIFHFYKFRTMVADADKKIEELASLNIYANGSRKANFFKIKDDPRITKIGLFLRNSSLDELPQLFNVLRGDMSIVGNRPLPLYEATTLTTNEWAERFMAPAGITGLWQISRRGNSVMSNEERILLDINYARNRSLKGDLKILMQTPTALIQKTNV